MTIHLYDGNNVRLRAMTKPQLANAGRLSLRQEFERFLNPDPSETHIWCWDGRNHNQRRLDIFPGYKVGREPMSEDHFSQIKLFREILTHTAATQFDCEGWEADDVVATLARHNAARGKRVVCHSNDMDYVQLEANPNITVNGVQNRPCPPRWICLYKAMRGDSSDRIPGIPGFGPKSWDNVQPYLDQIEDGIRFINPKAFEGLPFTPRVRTWLQDEANINQLRSYLLITHMFTVPEEELLKGVIRGSPNRAAGEALLDRYFL